MTRPPVPLRLVCLLAALLVDACLPARPEPGVAGAPIALRVQPDDGPPPLAAMIAGASRTIAVEVYMLTDGDILEALVAARTAGRDVTVILEGHPFGAATANDAAYDRLARAGVDVRWASARFALTHTKLLVVDGARAAVMTANLTRAGLTTNREYVALDDDPADVAAAQAMITADGDGRSFDQAGGRLVTAPESARPALLDLIDGAQEQLEVEMEELSDHEATDALVRAAARGVALTVVAPGADRGAATDAALAALAAADARVRLLAAPAVHAKAVVADGRRLYVGSINLTAASMDANREAGLIVDDVPAAGRVSRTIAGDAAAGAPP